MKYLLLFLSALYFVAFTANAQNVIIEVRNPGGNVEAALSLGQVASTEKDFDGFMEYEKIHEIQYPLPREAKEAGKSERVGLGTYVRISEFSEDDGLFTFNLRVDQNQFEKFIESFGPSRAIRTPVFTKGRIETRLTVEEGETEFAGMDADEPWSLRIIREE